MRQTLAWGLAGLVASATQPAAASTLPALDRADRTIQGSVGIAVVTAGASVDMRVAEGLLLGASYFRTLPPMFSGESYTALRATQRLWQGPAGAVAGLTASYGQRRDGDDFPILWTEVQPAVNLAIPMQVEDHQLVFRMTYGPVLALAGTASYLSFADPSGAAPRTIETFNLGLPRARWIWNPEIAIVLGRNFEVVTSGSTGLSVRAVW